MGSTSCGTRTLKTRSSEVSDLLSLPCAVHSLNSADPPPALDMDEDMCLTDHPAYLHLIFLAPSPPLCPPHLERSWPSSILLDHILLLHRTRNLGLNNHHGGKSFSTSSSKFYHFHDCNHPELCL